jgi:hypothetical protein
MMRLAILLCPLAATSGAAAREPRARVIYRVPAGPPAASPWAWHPVLSPPTPLLAVSDRDTTDGGTTAGFFARLSDLGFHCLAFEPPRRRIRRVEVVCSRSDGEGWSSYAGGWPGDAGVFVVDRIRAGRGGSAELLGGARVGAHLRGLVGGGAEPPERVMVVRDAPERQGQDPSNAWRSCGERSARFGRDFSQTAPCPTTRAGEPRVNMSPQLPLGGVR